MISVRDAFFYEVYKMLQSDKNIYVVSSDIGAPSLDDLRKYYPDHFINVGIAEQSLIGISAGLVQSGKKVVAYGLNPFPMTRAYDQVRCLMGELHIPITLCALNAGLCSALAGYTHMATEVFTMARMLPKMRIHTPTDEVMSTMLAAESINKPKPRYVLFDKSAGEKIYERDEINFNKGYAVYRPTKTYGVGVVGNSSHIKILREIADNFAIKDISVTVFDFFAIPVDEKSFISDVLNCQSVITVEENVLAGGLGSYVLEIISDNNLAIPVKRLGVDFNDGVPSVFMSRDYLLKLNGIDSNGIVAAIFNQVRN